MCHVFNGPGEHRYVMTQEKMDAVITGIAQSIKDGLPEEARRLDVICYLLDETKAWVKSQKLAL